MLWILSATLATVSEDATSRENVFPAKVLTKMSPQNVSSGSFDFSFAAAAAFFDVFALFDGGCDNALFGRFPVEEAIKSGKQKPPHGSP